MKVKGREFRHTLNYSKGIRKKFFRGQLRALLSGYIINVLDEDIVIYPIKTTAYGNFLFDAISPGNESRHTFRKTC